MRLTRGTGKRQHRGIRRAEDVQEQYPGLYFSDPI